jgi:NitT/TauT family transport system substrate-binding protein
MTLGVVSPSALNWIDFTADKQGFWKNEGLSVDIVFTRAAATSAQQVASGDIQVASAGLDPSLRAIEAGSDMVVIAGGTRVPPYNLVTKPDIKSWADLKGKKVIIGGAKDPTVFFLDKMFSANGLKLTDVDLVFAGSTADRFAALDSGAVDAAMLTQPFDLTAIGKGYPSLGWVGDYVTGYLFTGTVANRTWISSHKDEIDRYLKGLVKAYDWLTDKNNKAAAVKIMVDVSNQDAKYVEQTYDLYFGQGKKVFYPRERIDPADLEGTLDARVALGEQKPTVPVSRYLDLSYLDQAIAEVGS